MKAAKWKVTPKEAILIQKELSEKVLISGNPGKVTYVAGVDVGYKNKNIARAVVVILRFPSLELIEYSIAYCPVEFPYVPGLLTFREGPAVLDAFKKINIKPNLIIFDGQGIAHPRKMGIASHLGLLLDLPSIGCAKSKLYGTYSEEELIKNGTANLYGRGKNKAQILGKVIITKTGADPIFISPGHKVSLEKSVYYTLKCIKKGNRLPETTILAHNIASS